MGLLWKSYERRKWQRVIGGSILWEGQEIFLHLVPPLFSLKKGIPAVLVVDGEKRIALGEPRAILVTEFLERLFSGGTRAYVLTAEKLDEAVLWAAAHSARLLRRPRGRLEGQARAIWEKAVRSAQGKEEPRETLDYSVYLPYYRAPYRALLLLDRRLANGSWKRIMDALAEAGVTWIVLSRGSERCPLRSDLADLAHFQRTVRVSVDEGAVTVSPLYDVVVDEEGFVLEQGSGKRIGSLLEQPFPELWKTRELWEERLFAACAGTQERKAKKEEG